MSSAAVVRSHGPARRAAAVAIAAALLSGACSDSGDDDGDEAAAQASTTTTTTTSTTTPSTTSPVTVPLDQLRVEVFDVPRGSRPHDVAVADDGRVWYTAQGSGELGRLDPRTRAIEEVALGRGSAPHGVIVGPDGAAWVTDGGLNAIVRVDARTLAVDSWPLPAGRADANLNTAVFDRDGTLWFTGQSGIYGRLDPGSGRMDVFDAPRGRGPYGITATPAGDVYYASLAGSFVGRIDRATGATTVLEPPTRAQGTRRVWTDSRGRIWCSQWDAGQVAVYDPATGAWDERALPGADPQAYAVYVDDRDVVWLTDFGGNALVRFDPASGAFTPIPLPASPANVRQLLGRPGEVWGAQSAADSLIVVQT
jgi:virginiamycin B lyase